MFDLNYVRQCARLAMQGGSEASREATEQAAYTVLFNTAHNVYAKKHCKARMWNKNSGRAAV